MRKYARKDTNQDEIVERWLKLPGTSFASIHTVGGGVPDGIFGVNGHTLVVEIKNPEYARVKGGPLADMSEDEVDFYMTWTGSLKVVYYYEDLLPFYFWALTVAPLSVV